MHGVTAMSSERKRVKHTKHSKSGAPPPGMIDELRSTVNTEGSCNKLDEWIVDRCGNAFSRVSQSR